MQAITRLAWPALAAAVLMIPMPALASHSNGDLHPRCRPRSAPASIEGASSIESDPVFAYVKKQAGLRLARRYTPLIHHGAARYHLPPLLVAGIINFESHFDTHCRTGRACGLMQVNHGHERPGQNLFDPETNIGIGCRILREYHDWAAHRMPADSSSWQVWNKALTAYNYGPIQVVNRGLIRSHYSRTIIHAWQSSLPPDDR